MRLRLFTAGLACGLALAACTPKPPPTPNSSPAPAVEPERERAQAASPWPSSNVNGPIKAVSQGTRREPARYIVRDKNGQVVYDILSSTVVYDRAPDGSAVAAFTSPHVVFHARSGRTVAADSPKAVAHDKDKSVLMTGGVHAKTDDGKTLACTTLTYDARDQRILCEGDVVLRNTINHQTASGDRLLTDPDFNHVVLSGSR